MQYGVLKSAVRSSYSCSCFPHLPFSICAWSLCFCWHCGETQQPSWETDLFVSHFVLLIAVLGVVWCVRVGRGYVLGGLFLFALSICLLVQKQTSSGRTEMGRHWVSSLCVPLCSPCWGCRLPQHSSSPSVNPPADMHINGYALKLAAMLPDPCAQRWASAVSCIQTKAWLTPERWD